MHRPTHILFKQQTVQLRLCGWRCCGILWCGDLHCGYVYFCQVLHPYDDTSEYLKARSAGHRIVRNVVESTHRTKRFASPSYTSSRVRHPETPGIYQNHSANWSAEFDSVPLDSWVWALLKGHYVAVFHCAMSLLAKSDTQLSERFGVHFLKRV